MYGKTRYRESTKRATRTHESQRRTNSQKMAPQDVYTSGVQRTRHRKPRSSTDLEPTKNLDQSTALVVETTEVTQEIVADFCAVRPVDNVSRQPFMAEETYAKMSPTEKSAEATVQVL